MWYWSLPTEMKTQRNGSSWVFYTRLDEEWEVVGKCDRTNRQELNAVNWGKLSKDCSFGFLLESLVLGGKDAPFLRVHIGRVPPTRGSMTCIRGRPDSPSCTCHVSYSFSLIYLICHGAIVCGSMRSKLSHYKVSTISNLRTLECFNKKRASEILMPNKLPGEGWNFSHFYRYGKWESRLSLPILMLQFLLKKAFRKSRDCNFI